MYSWSWIKATIFFFYFCDWILHFAGVCAVCVEQLKADHKNNNSLVGNIYKFILHNFIP